MSELLTDLAAKKLYDAFTEKMIRLHEGEDQNNTHYSIKFKRKWERYLESLGTVWMLALYDFKEAGFSGSSFALQKENKVFVRNPFFDTVGGREYQRHSSFADLTCYIKIDRELAMKILVLGELP